MVFGPEFAQFIKQNFPVVKKRSALWFFTNEIRNNLEQPVHKLPIIATNPANHDLNAKDKASNKGVNQVITSCVERGSRRISRNKIYMLWKNMDPESKRKYFNMAEFDEIRYKEQKSQWVSEVGLLMLKHKGSLTKVGAAAPTYDKLQEDFLGSLENIHKSYETMIEAESTKTLYKDAIKRADHSELGLDSEELISALPNQHRPILARPRRPPVPFILYFNDNIARYKSLRKDQDLQTSCWRMAGDEWAKLDPETKATYEERYNKLRDEYNKAMVEYKSKVEAENNGHLVHQALKERKAFKKSLRKRLRDASIVPLSTRNAFNFFLMDNNDVKLLDLTEIWRNLPEEQKLKYIKMSEEDTIRYKDEKIAYQEIKKCLSELLGKTSITSED